MHTVRYLKVGQEFLFGVTLHFLGVDIPSIQALRNFLTLDNCNAAALRNFFCNGQTLWGAQPVSWGLPTSWGFSPAQASWTALHLQLTSILLIHCGNLQYNASVAEHQAQGVVENVFAQYASSVTKVFCWWTRVSCGRYGHFLQLDKLGQNFTLRYFFGNGQNLKRYVTVQPLNTLRYLHHRT